MKVDVFNEAKELMGDIDECNRLIEHLEDKAALYATEGSTLCIDSTYLSRELAIRSINALLEVYREQREELREKLATL